MSAEATTSASVSVPQTHAIADEVQERSDFSMVLGGPLYQLLLRMRIAREPLDLLTRRVIAISLLAWLPPLFMAIAIGRAWGGVQVPFLLDVSAHVRFLVSLPLLILAEWLVHMRFRPLIAQFVARDIIAPEDRGRFDEIIESSKRLRNSVLAEVILLVVVFTGGQLLWRSQGALHTGTWYADAGPNGLQLTAAGMCYAYWSQPLYQFILIRWYFRLFIWTRFLWKVSRLNLRLIPTHPDCAGGLGFLTGSAHALMPLLIAQSATIAGIIANRIFFEGAGLTQFKIEILLLVLFLVAQALVPLMVFAPILMRCQRLGNREYGLLASRYVQDFDRKWVHGACDRKELMGTADIQSLADLANSFDVIRSMSPFPFSKAVALRLVIVTALPLLPLTLTVIPFEELVDRMLKLVL